MRHEIKKIFIRVLQVFSFAQIIYITFISKYDIFLTILNSNLLNIIKFINNLY